MITPAHTTEDAGRTASIPYSELSVEQKLRAFWNAFCDCDFHEDGFVEEMEAAGFVSYGTATQEDVEATPFADELGIVKGHGIWRLTDAGRAALSASRTRSTGE